MINVGITGQAGFIGTHLYNYLNLKKEEIKLIPFEDKFFQDDHRLEKFVSECDAIVHLAAMNRHGDPQVIYETNIGLVKQLIQALEVTGKQAHVLFSSSTQEERDNLYGRSKRDGRELLEQWAKRSNSQFTGFVIPNVFGPFGNPFYNSVVATFCHQLVSGIKPEIHVDSSLQLIYVGELVKLFYEKMKAVPDRKPVEKYKVKHTSENSVSAILKLLESYKSIYFDKHIFPDLNGSFEVNLFNTFRSYMDHGSRYPVKVTKNEDYRGLFSEVAKTSLGGQFSFGTTFPGKTRGNHFHTRKIERFIVIRGKALIEFRRIGSTEVISFELDGSEPSFVDIPVWVTHNIKNTGTEEMIALFWINEFFNPEDPDTFWENV